MNSFWITWRKECGQWAWTDGYIGNFSSIKCTNAMVALQQNAKYTDPLNVIVPVPSSLIKSIQDGIWNNTLLQ
jgi:hypothetical protein